MPAFSAFKVEGREMTADGYMRISMTHDIARRAAIANTTGTGLASGMPLTSGRRQRHFYCRASTYCSSTSPDLRTYPTTQPHAKCSPRRERLAYSLLKSSSWLWTLMWILMLALMCKVLMFGDVPGLLRRRMPPRRRRSLMVLYGTEWSSTFIR